MFDGVPAATCTICEVSTKLGFECSRLLRWAFRDRTRLENNKYGDEPGQTAKFEAKVHSHVQNETSCNRNLRSQHHSPACLMSRVTVPTSMHNDLNSREYNNAIDQFL